MIRSLQVEHRGWLEHNFPIQDPIEPLLGLGEELGELMHAHLKGMQGIRHTPEEIEDMKFDAVGDIFIYLMSYCNASGIDLEDAVLTTWRKVSQRDWQADPMRAGNDG